MVLAEVANTAHFQRSEMSPPLASIAVSSADLPDPDRHSSIIVSLGNPDRSKAISALPASQPNRAPLTIASDRSKLSRDRRSHQH
jgi:hypothetical protein